MIRAKKDFMMQKMLNDYMIIAVGESSEKFRSIIQTNETGAFYWKMIEQGTTTDKLIQAALDRFEDLDEITARRDINEFLKSISPALEKAQ